MYSDLKYNRTLVNSQWSLITNLLSKPLPISEELVSHRLFFHFFSYESRVQQVYKSRWRYKNDNHHLEPDPNQPLTLTTFLFPFDAPAGGVPGPPPMAEFSTAFMPALTVSIRTPVEMAGEYGGSRLPRDGWGSGGTGNRRPPRCWCWGAAGDLDFIAAGCLPLFDVVGLLLLGLADAESDPGPLGLVVL